MNGWVNAQFKYEFNQMEIEANDTAFEFAKWLEKTGRAAENSAPLTYFNNDATNRRSLSVVLPALITSKKNITNQNSFSLKERVSRKPVVKKTTVQHSFITGSVSPSKVVEKRTTHNEDINKEFSAINESYRKIDSRKKSYFS